MNGSYSNKDNLCPAYISNLNPKNLEIDEIFYSTIIVVNYYREQNELVLKTLIDTNLNMNISIFYEKQDTYKIIKDITYHIGNVSADLKTIGNNRQDVDIAAFTYNDAKYIRREMQVNNEDLYFLYLYITVYSNDLKQLEHALNKIEGILQSKGLQCRRATFRQEQGFKSSLPLMHNDEDLKKVAKRNVLTSSLVSTFPFISSTIFDEKGIFIGTNIYNDSMVFIDRYNSDKYKNANMCVFGTSGSGKSFFTKLLIIRYNIIGISQYVIDPDREYYNLCKALDGTYIKLGPTSNTYINILDIRKESIEENEEGYLASKIPKIVGFFNLICNNLNEEDKALLETKIIEVYKRKGINFDDNSLYIKEKNKFKSTQEMPILEDLYNVLNEDKRTKKLGLKLIPFVRGSLKYMNNHTNIELMNGLIIADVYDLGEENLKYGMYLFTELFWDKIKIDRNERKAIYLDEIWRLIGVTSNGNVASFIYKIFKTIRKYGGGGIAITQDVSDLFSLEDGIYGRSILNNSSIKSFFNLEEENIRILEKYTNLSEKEKVEIKSLRKGESVLFVGENHIVTKIESSEMEKSIILRGEVDEEDYNSYK